MRVRGIMSVSAGSCIFSYAEKHWNENVQVRRKRGKCSLTSNSPGPPTGPAAAFSCLSLEPRVHFRYRLERKKKDNERCIAFMLSVERE